MEPWTTHVLKMVAFAHVLPMSLGTNAMYVRLGGMIFPTVTVRYIIYIAILIFLFLKISLECSGLNKIL